MEHTKQKRTKRNRIPNISFELSVNNRLFNVNASPYTLPSGDMQYRVSYNNGPVHVFSWDEGLERFAEADGNGDAIPPVVEMEIAGRLHEFAEEMQHAA